MSLKERVEGLDKSEIDGEAKVTGNVIENSEISSTAKYLVNKETEFIGFIRRIIVQDERVVVEYRVDERKILKPVTCEMFVNACKTYLSKREGPGLAFFDIELLFASRKKDDVDIFVTGYGEVVYMLSGTEERLTEGFINDYIEKRNLDVESKFIINNGGGRSIRYARIELNTEEV